MPETYAETSAPPEEKRRRISKKVWSCLGVSALVASVALGYSITEQVDASQSNGSASISMTVGPEELTYIHPSIDTTTTTIDPFVLQQQAWEEQAAQANAHGEYDRLAYCETQGNWQMRGSRYSGGVGFANSTWKQFHLSGMPANAGEATKAQQIVVAERVRWEVPPSGSWRGGKWGCAPTAGLP